LWCHGWPVWYHCFIILTAVYGINHWNFQYRETWNIELFGVQARWCDIDLKNLYQLGLLQVVYFISYLGFFWFSLWPTTSVLITITSYLLNDLKVKGHGWTNTELWNACITRLIYKDHEVYKIMENFYEIMPIKIVLCYAENK
jgi:hypothetical protein